MLPSSAVAPASEAELEELLSRPTRGVVGALAGLSGDLVLLGGGGKVGPTLARMARRALDETGNPHKVISVSRWSDAAAADRCEEAEDLWFLPVAFASRFQLKG